MFTWIFVKKEQTWLIGTEKSGCGVFKENGKWTGNVVVGNNIEGLEDFDTPDAAKKAAEKQWQKRLNS
jgi:hypothetical protein